MNCARNHTDGEHHEGDGLIGGPCRHQVINGKIVPTENQGAPHRADMTMADLDASLYLIRNQDRPETEWDALPDNLTADDVVRAIARQNARKQLNRVAIAAHEKALSTALPKSSTTYLCKIQNCGRKISAPGYCEDCGGEMMGTPAPLIPWSTILYCLAALIGVVAALTWLVIE